MCLYKHVSLYQNCILYNDYFSPQNRTKSVICHLVLITFNELTIMIRLSVFAFVKLNENIIFHSWTNTNYNQSESNAWTLVVLVEPPFVWAKQTWVANISRRYIELHWILDYKHSSYYYYPVNSVFVSVL